ncbi:hypothetical protein F0P96_03050 [Hymenobacter busanensis]|uniref:Uncharacterized protein n=1 Tax=Hymenobacter busanensis TaxID=2607656 RepID=A0A7L4ZYV0_9BACT|nr:carboxypeptidase-like regulatory domain-containing protein [Hymenobacter busanensis]KAA9339605.1 hypothetical protein F0P96_03050 [Hymenobacter busanensis]QHJ06640.1 hypothetical protein GUY19_04705 [Hymenobacter busanensis]
MSADYEPTNTDEQLHDEEESLDSGNRKLAIIAGAVLLLGGLAFAFAPAENRQRIANGQMPTFELMEANVVGTREAEEEPTATETPAQATASAATPVAQPVAVRPAPRTTRPAPVDNAQPSTPEVAAAPAPEPVAAAPAPAVEEAPRNVTMSGRVLDENGKPLAGATIFVKGTRKFASTDQNGNYSVEVPAGENSLVYGYGGYEDQEVRARSGQPSNVTLIPSETGRRRKR